MAASKACTCLVSFFLGGEGFLFDKLYILFFFSFLCVCFLLEFSLGFSLLFVFCLIGYERKICLFLFALEIFAHRVTFYPLSPRSLHSFTVLHGEAPSREGFHISSYTHNHERQEEKINSLG